MAERLVTVLGGTGFLGRHIVRCARNAGYKVRIAARHPGPQRSASKNPGIEQIVTDVRDPEAVAGAVRGADGVVNVVGLYVESRDESFEMVHVIGAGHVANAAKRMGARLVHISGIGVDRRSPSPYVRARALGEERVLDAYPESVILRPSALFGHGDALLSAMKPLVKWLPVIPLFEEGRSRMQPVHADDVARAVTAALERPEVAGGVYELGGPDVLTYRELLEGIAASLGRRRRYLPVKLRTWKLLAMLPGAPVTRDQIELLRRDNIVQADRTFEDLGIDTASLQHVLDAAAGREPDAPGEAAG